MANKKIKPSLQSKLQDSQGKPVLRNQNNNKCTFVLLLYERHHYYTRGLVLN